MSRWPYKGMFPLLQTSQSKKILQLLEEACRMVLELTIPEEELVEVHIHKLAIGVCETWIEMEGV